MKDSHLKSIIKGFTWRLLGTFDTMMIAYFFTGNTHIALTIGSTEFFTKIFLYYFHERLWQLPNPLRSVWKKLSDTESSN